MLRVTNGFNKLNLSSFIETLNNISGKMDGNANFPTLQNDVARLNSAKDAFFEQAAKATLGSRYDAIVRDAQREAITIQLHNMGFAVTAIAAGDLVMLQSSGFSFTKPRQTSAPMVKP